MKLLKTALKLSSLTFWALSLAHCSSSSGGSSSGSTTTPSVPYCSTITTYSDAITITGSANYEYRINGNGAVASPAPIRHAEIRVSDSSGAIIQCGETDSSGNFSLQLPNNGQAVTLAVASRADNSFMKLYVMNNPTNNAYYALTTSVTLDANKSVGTLTASATGTIIPGGAFHIFDKILDANEYLRTQTANCASTFSQCVEVSVVPMVNVYWTKGVNPGDYYGLGPLSFYLPDKNHLYILGGYSGDVDTADTDHFDTSVILHEYGHALEQHFAVSDSPGGSHLGDQILDPRLAWSEGWADFFQAAVTGVPVYRDTAGTPLGSPTAFQFNLETSSHDVPSTTAEGNFREFSITRALYDLVDTNNENPSIDNQQGLFPEIWSVFSGKSNGFADTSQKFRSLGLFYLLQNGLSGKSDWSTIQNAEKQLAARTNYANTLNNSTCSTAILAENVPESVFSSPEPGQQAEDGSFVNSNQFKSNDFFQFTHSGGALTINLSYSTTSGNAANLDLYLYTYDYLFGNSNVTNMIGRSESSILNSASSGTEQISFSNLAAGTYMINVHYDTTGGIKSSASYSLNINSADKCPN